MTHLSIEEIPTEILKSVHTKWSRILMYGEWNPITMWQPCDLCHYIDTQRGPIKCKHICPLDMKNWCTEEGSTSRLNPNYYRIHHASNGTEEREMWLTAVERFIRMLNNEFHRRNDKCLNYLFSIMMSCNGN